MEDKHELVYKKVPILEGMVITSHLPSMEKIYESAVIPIKTKRTFLYIAACTVNIVSFISGTSLGWTSPEIPLLKNLSTSPLAEKISPSEESWVGSSLALAAVVGPIVGGILVDKIGRKKAILIGNVSFFIAYLINIFANVIYYFFLARLLCGFGLGIIFTAVPMYIGEISDDEVRGSLGSFMQLFVVIGMFFSYALGPYLPIKTFNILLLIPPVIFLILFAVFIPDSPYYLILSGNNEDALEALIKLKGGSKSLAQKELEIMQGQVEKDLKNKGSLVETLKIILNSKGQKMALFISLNLVAWQQLSGICVVLFFTQTIFTDAGASLAPEICTIITGFVQIVASAATPLLVERRGKRFLLMLSGIGMGLSQGVLAYFFYMKDDQLKDVSSIGWVPIVSLVVFIITYCLGFGPLPWAVMGELFPGNVKSVASSATASFCWILGFILTNYFAALTTMIGKSGSFGLFTTCCFLSAVFVYKYLPETSGKSLSEIQALLSGEK